MTEAVPKRRKTEHLKCTFYLEKKKRCCAMQRKADKPYCSEHMIHQPSTGERVPCPLDGKHTVWAKDLESHLKKCNAKPKDKQDPWYKEDLNVTIQTKNVLETTQTPKSTVEEEDEEKNEELLLKKYVTLVQQLQFEPLPLKRSSHVGLNDRLAELKVQKHAMQQASLIGNMKDNELLLPNYCYLEFGCGKAELSRYVNTCVLEEIDSQRQYPSYSYGLIDRGVNRMKMDPQIRKTAEEANIPVKVKRTRIDIKDLDLDVFIQDMNPSKVVGISKHLCGAATDLTLKLLLNSSVLKEGKFGGMLIAMCCRHVCSYEQLLPQSQDYLASRGFKTEQSFGILRKMVSWAVCGKRDENPTAEHVSGLSYDEREALGFCARRLIDESRVHALKLLIPDFDVDMFLYIENEVTLENVCLCIKPKN